MGVGVSLTLSSVTGGSCCGGVGGGSVTAVADVMGIDGTITGEVTAGEVEVDPGIPMEILSPAEAADTIGRVATCCLGCGGI